MDIAIKAEDLKKYFGTVKAVDGISFDVKKGEVFGLLGPNGAGKTTTISILTTTMKPGGGKACILGNDVAENQDSVRMDIGIVFQDPSVDNELTGRENMDLHGRLYGMKSKTRKRMISRLLELVDLKDAADRRVKEYSGGMRRRLEIARGLLHKPKVLFLDEPTLGLDPQTRRKIWEHIKSIVKGGKLTIMLTTHYMEEADELCDRVAIIDHGKIIALDTPKNLKELLGGDVIVLKLENGANRAAEILKKIPGMKNVKQIGSEITMTVSGAEKKVPVVLRKVERHRLKVASVEIRKPTLEDVFIHYTGRSIRDEKASAVDRLRVMRMRRGP